MPARLAKARNRVLTRQPKMALTNGRARVPAFGHGEVEQLSLYLKPLEEETAATVQPTPGGYREQLLPHLT